MAGMGRAMKGGLGSEDLVFDDGLVVAALVAVNAVGSVVDPADGSVVAGVRREEASEGGSVLMAPAELLLRGQTTESRSPVESTTLVVVATNAHLTKAQATKIAQMAHDGLARTIVPIHTPFDGDTVFVLGTGQWSGEDGAVDVGRLGALAAEATAQAVLRAVRQADGLPGLPSASDLQETASAEQP